MQKLNDNDNQELRKVVEVLRREFPRLAHDYRLRSMGIFGSLVRNEHRDTSHA